MHAHTKKAKENSIEKFYIRINTRTFYLITVVNLFNAICVIFIM